MSTGNETTKQEPQSESESVDQPAKDDRRGEVKPTDNPVPSSPEPEPNAIREGEEKLGRVKPY